MTYIVQTEPSPRVPATGTLPALRTIVLYRNGMPVEPLPAPAGALPSRIPAMAADVVAHFRIARTSTAPRRASVVSPFPSPPVVAADVVALRERAGLSQRAAAEGAGVSRGLVGELETPRPSRVPRVASPQAQTYVAWLQQQVARIEAAE